MKRFVTLFALGAVVLFFSLALAGEQCKQHQASAKQDAVILKGEIVEAGCFVERGQRAADNRNCIKKCASSGMPMAFVADDNTVYLIIKCHDAAVMYGEAIKLAAEKVEIKGFVYERSGLKAIAVTDVKRLEVASK